jgi:hypothetical protein
VERRKSQAHRKRIMMGCRVILGAEEELSGHYASRSHFERSESIFCFSLHDCHLAPLILISFNCVTFIAIYVLENRQNIIGIYREQHINIPI